MAIDKRLQIFDEQGNLVDYDIMATDVKFSGGKDLPTKLAELEDEIGDAGGGYEPPVGGIPKEDLAPGVQTSLGLADTAYQKPNTGIPATDIAPGVIPDVSNLATKTELADKVDKVPGKGLSTNDYTDAEKTKLAGLPTNPVTSISVNGQTAQTPSNGNVNLVIEAGAQGQKGDKGDTVVLDPQSLPQFTIVNDLTTGGEADALSAEMGRRLAMLSGTYAEAWAHAQAIPYVFPWLWVETVGGDAICKPIWHRGSSNFVDAAGASISIEVTGSAGVPTISGTEGATVPKDTVITITPASGCALHYSVDGGSTYKVADRTVNITLSTAGAKVIMAYCSNPNGNSSTVTRNLTVAGTAVPTFAAKPNSGTTLTQKSGYIEVSRGGYVRISGAADGTLYYSTDGENYTEVQGNNYYDFQIADDDYEATAFVIYAKNKVGNDFSDPVTGTFKMAALDAPSFSPASNTEFPATGGTVTITATNGDSIKYTTDDSDPISSGTAVTVNALTASVNVTAQVTIKAIAHDSYGDSALATATYSTAVPKLKVTASAATTMNLGDSSLGTNGDITINAGLNEFTPSDLGITSFANKVFPSLSFGNNSLITHVDGGGIKICSLSQTFLDATNHPGGLVSFKGVVLSPDGSTNSSLYKAFNQDYSNVLAEIEISGTINGYAQNFAKRNGGVSEMTIDLSGLTGTITGNQAQLMFQKCMVEVIDLSGIDITATNASSMFNGCTKLATLKIKKLAVSGNNATLNMFNSASALKTLVVTEETPYETGWLSIIGDQLTAIYVPDNSVTAYTQHSEWGNYASKIQGISNYSE